MSVVLYIGGSKDGEKGVMPYGFSKSMKETASGPEIYVERVLAVSDRQVRIMALESLQDEIVVERLHKYYSR
ncbi:hypothetical protein QSH18_04195 [Xanthomonas sp. NCPPB 2654]|jgi:hypothetical protein|uniref:hypothetical protein n=1 Tax=unclassified Xanthomonas TaxID=2643310 RepID=UPI0021E05940|nr:MULTISPECIES: hypothetical protein [unclassified Xanthomonas]MDL5364795.1 hypothetical protein [Xanthomonas sp. NCPPB 2654]MDR6674940.1 hypothetical protein [Xanthomonas translucens]MEB1529305.1 hypothetical protein [Xanthomonas campestris pv. campestris]UYC18823.1 hypothetical protein NUG20_11455 [Xanthomonas sp. CFBP 8443]